MALLWFLGGFLTAVLLVFGALAIFSVGVSAGKKNTIKATEPSDSEGVK